MLSNAADYVFSAVALGAAVGSFAAVVYTILMIADMLGCA